MMPFRNFQYSAFLFALWLSISGNPCIADPINTVNQAPNLAPVPTADEANADQAKKDFAKAHGHILEYEEQLKSQLSRINSQEQGFEKQCALLQKNIQANPKEASAGKAELSKLKAWLHQAQLSKGQLQQQLNNASGWDAYYRDRYGNAQYAVSQDNQEQLDKDKQANDVATHLSFQKQLQDIADARTAQQKAEEEAARKAAQTSQVPYIYGPGYYSPGFYNPGWYNNPDVFHGSIVHTDGGWGGIVHQGGGFGGSIVRTGGNATGGSIGH